MNEALDQIWAQWEPWIRMTELRFGTLEGMVEGDLARMRTYFDERPAYALAHFDAYVAALGA